jgi:hypothetical protein
METRRNHVPSALGKEKNISGEGYPRTVRKRSAPPVNIRIQAAGGSEQRDRQERDAKKEAVSHPAGEGPEWKSSAGGERHRRAGSSGSEIHWGVSRPPFTEKRSKRPGFAQRGRQPMGMMLLSVGAALVLGAIMGFSILSLFFSDDPVLSSRSIDSHLERNPSPGGESASKRQDLFSLPDLKAVLIQGGSFTEKERAQQTIQSHRSKGRAAVMTDTSPHRIFWGVANNRDDALKLSVTYEKEKADVYLKDLHVKGDQVRLPEGATREVEKELSRFVKDGHQIFRRLAESTTSFLGSASSSRFSDPTHLEKAHRRMMEAGTRLEKQLPSGTRSPLQDMMMAADQALQSAREARQNPSAALAWQTQEGLVRYALAYEAFISSLK